MIVLFFERGDEMSISSTVKKIMPYIKTTSGYVLHRLSSQAVEMDDGTTLEEKVTALNNLISQKVDTSTVVNNLLTTEEGFVLDARQGKTLNDSISDLSSNSYNLTSGILGIEARPYALKKYNDGTFEFWGRMDASTVRFTHSDSSGVYYAMLNAPLPDELSINTDKPYIFEGAVESSGIYEFSPRDIDASNIYAYVHANATPEIVSYLSSYFKITGFYM